MILRPKIGDIWEVALPGKRKIMVVEIWASDQHQSGA